MSMKIQFERRKISEIYCFFLVIELRIVKERDEDGKCKMFGLVSFEHERLMWNSQDVLVNI